MPEYKLQESNMARKKNKEEKIWAYKLKHPEASNREIAAATKASYAYVWKLMSKIGTPKEVLEAPKEEQLKLPLDPPLSVTRTSILKEAETLVSKDRAEQHGDAESNFVLMAAYWNAHLGLRDYIKVDDVPIMLALMKVARLHGNNKHIDNYVDVCGYMALGGEIAGSD
jgi:hypothetical protein